MPNGTEYYHLPATVLTQHPQLMTCRVCFSSSMAETHWKDVPDYLGSTNIRYLGNDKGLILFSELHKLWLTHAKSLQENRLSKTETVERNKNFKSHNFKVGQSIAVKNQLRNTFETKFISDYRILNIINECTLLIESPDGKTQKININDAKPVSAITATDNALQEFKQLMLKKEHTHPYALRSSSM